MSETKRTNLLITIFDLHFGGISNLILQTAPALMKTMNVEVVYFGNRDEMLQRYRDAGIVTTRIPYRGLKDLPKTGKKLGQFIGQKQIDVVSTHLFVDKAITTVAKRYANFKILGTLHSVNNPYSAFDFRFILNSKFEDFFHNSIADKNFAVSEATLDSWKKYRNLNPENTRVLYSGIEKLPCEISISKDFEKSDNIFVTACRITPEKGLERLINFFDLLNEHHPNWQFWILGTGNLKSELELLVKKLNLENKILFKGFQTELCKFYKDADFYINSSFQEALPVSVLEAMSVGLPVIGSKVGGIPEVVSHENNGYLVDFSNAEESFQTLKKSLHISKEKYSSFSENSKSIFDSKFSIDNYVKNFTEEMKTLVQNNYPG